VANYRASDEHGNPTLGRIGRWFAEAYSEVAAKPRYANLRLPPVDGVHGGYFSVDNRQRPRDTRGDSAADVDTYDLIMREKERLLSVSEAMRCIFSHSALREGWVNPNVFQICTLNETRTPDRKRQEIGRGLRLPVNQDGERIHDPLVNRLTIVANEAYEQFARPCRRTPPSPREGVAAVATLQGPLAQRPRAPDRTRDQILSSASSATASAGVGQTGVSYAELSQGILQPTVRRAHPERNRLPVRLVDHVIVEMFRHCQGVDRPLGSQTLSEGGHVTAELRERVPAWSHRRPDLHLDDQQRRGSSAQVD
jgi:hypothetical protein